MRFSNFADAHTMAAFLPPISSDTCFDRLQKLQTTVTFLLLGAHSVAIFFPTTVLPVKETRATSGFVMRASPTFKFSQSLVSTVSTHLGSRAEHHVRDAIR